MFSQRIRSVMEHGPMISARPEDTVRLASELMAGNHVGAVLVVQDDELKGIFTPIDAVKRVLAKGLDAERTVLADVMTASPRTVGPDWTFGSALKLMHDHGLSQMPVVENGRPIGIVCSRDALDPEMEEFAVEAHRREGYGAMVITTLPLTKA